MATAGKTRRTRKCRVCAQVLYTDAQGIKEHASQCARLKALGLEGPTLVIPKLVLK